MNGTPRLIRSEGKATLFQSFHNFVGGCTTLLPNNGERRLAQPRNISANVTVSYCKSTLLQFKKIGGDLKIALGSTKLRLHTFERHAHLVNLTLVECDHKF